MTIKTQIDALLPDNSAGEISAADVRNSFHKVIDATHGQTGGHGPVHEITIATAGTPTESELAGISAIGSQFVVRDGATGDIYLVVADKGKHFFTKMTAAA